jgi:hypothetical protein
MSRYAVEADEQVLAYHWWRRCSLGQGRVILGCFGVSFPLFAPGGMDIVPSVVA